MINYLIHGEIVLEDFKNWNIPEWGVEKILPYSKSGSNSMCNKNYDLKEDFCLYSQKMVKL